MFHKNLITGVGRINKSTLKNIGKFYGVRPEELVFLKKEDVKKVIDAFPKTNFNSHGIGIVFWFWSRLNPDKLFNNITQKEFEEIYRSVRRLRILWN